MKLPARFLSEMSVQFAESGMAGEWPDFLASFDQPPLSGIRGNLSKGIDQEALKRLLAKMAIQPTCTIPWSTSGCQLPSSIPPALAPGRHPYYHAGLFYLQEPSAMLPAEVLAALPGERVMDLCAAPGGKSTRIAESMEGRGLLFCNDIHADRARILIRNLELHGVSNAIVLNESPDHIANRLPGAFDRVLVDAPCSGEGMFRRDGRAVSGWDRFGPEKCALMQGDILQAADRMLKPGGFLVYSTCTFSHLEDEGTIARFLSAHPAYEILPIPVAEGLSPGISLPDRGGLSPAQAARTVRIWPHRAAGEGHFCALLQKHGELQPTPDTPGQRMNSRNELALLLDNAGVQLSESAVDRISDEGAWMGTTDARGGEREVQERHYHWLPTSPPDLAGLWTLKHGLYIGTRTTDRRGYRFEPSHSLLLAFRRSDLHGCLDLALDDNRVLRYLRGETLSLNDQENTLSGRVPVFVDGHPLGWGKADGSTLMKNLYPKSWRKMT